MPFCPSCRSEYDAKVTTCAECDTALVAALPDETSDESMVDVFVCYDRQQAERVVELLTEAGIEALLRDRASTAFPTTVGHTADKFVAVAEHQFAEAVGLLKDAVQDEVITTDGQILGA